LITKTDHIVVFQAPIAFPGMANRPTDLNGDGIYEDINGNGRWDYQDIVLLFQHMAWAGINQPIPAFDINENGRIDFGDISGLWYKMGGL